MKYKVITGIFEGHIFEGEISFNGKTVWDLNSYGRGYPIENCKELKEDE